jgi:hypothetical protein
MCGLPNTPTRGTWFPLLRTALLQGHRITEILLRISHAAAVKAKEHRFFCKLLNFLKFILTCK